MYLINNYSSFMHLFRYYPGDFYDFNAYLCVLTHILCINGGFIGENFYWIVYARCSPQPSLYIQPHPMGEPLQFSHARTAVNVEIPTLSPPSLLFFSRFYSLMVGDIPSLPIM